MAQAICQECSFQLDLPPQVQLAKVLCPRCKGSLAPAAALAAAAPARPPSPAPTPRDSPAPQRPVGKRRDVRPKARTNPLPSARSSPDREDEAAEEAGMNRGLKITLIAVPAVAAVAALLFILLNNGSSRDATKLAKGDDKSSVTPGGREGDGRSDLPEPPAAIDRGDPAKQQHVQFLGAVGQGRRFVIIADRSGSMKAKVRGADGGVRDSMSCLHEELVRTLQTLEAGSFFYVSFFGSTIVPMPGADTWVEGGRDLADIAAWVRSVSPSGGTNPLPAFVKALSLDPAPDVIFFMTDGVFTDVSAQIAKMNEALPKKVAIHTIHFNNAGAKGGAPLGTRQARLMETFELPPPVHALFAMHAKAPVAPAKIGRPHKLMEDIASASGGTFRVYGAAGDDAPKIDDAPKKPGPRVAPVLAVAGELTNLDAPCPFRAGCHCKSLDVVLQAGMTYQIDMVGGMDPFLFLQSAAGKMVASNDNSGGNLNALVVYRPTVTGLFRIIATSSAPGRTGAFAVSVIDRPF